MPRYIDADLADRLLTDGYRIDEIPSSDVAPVLHAHWVSIGNGMYACSKCHSTEECETPYCAICGARMERRAKNEQIH